MQNLNLNEYLDLWFVLGLQQIFESSNFLFLKMWSVLNENIYKMKILKLLFVGGHGWVAPVFDLKKILE